MDFLGLCQMMEPMKTEMNQLKFNLPETRTIKSTNFSANITSMLITCRQSLLRQLRKFLQNLDCGRLDDRSTKNDYYQTFVLQIILRQGGYLLVFYKVSPIFKIRRISIIYRLKLFLIYISSLNQRIIFWHTSGPEHTIRYILGRRLKTKKIEQKSDIIYNQLSRGFVFRTKLRHFFLIANSNLREITCTMFPVCSSIFRTRGNNRLVWDLALFLATLKLQFKIIKSYF